MALGLSSGLETAESRAETETSQTRNPTKPVPFEVDFLEYFITMTEG